MNSVEALWAFGTLCLFATGHWITGIVAAVVVLIAVSNDL